MEPAFTSWHGRAVWFVFLIVMGGMNVYWFALITKGLIAALTKRKSEPARKPPPRKAKKVE